MGTTLKSTDILGEIKSEQAKATALPKPPTSSKTDDRVKRASEFGEGKPSVYQSDLRAKLRQKTQLNFAAVPVFVKDEFDRLAASAGMNKREYFYHLLREQGADIPPYDEMDGRRL